MPRVDFESLPDSARVWVYGADRDLVPGGEEELLQTVDSFLDQWAAHGTPLDAARDWREGRFLTIAVDQEKAGASGCSIDVLFRNLKALESRVGAHLVPSGMVYLRDRAGKIQAVTRPEFTDLAERGEIDDKTKVFDVSVVTLGEWRGRFESHAHDSWHRALMPERA
jgi:hypothetical protein